ncbi:MAG: hypothetical protein JJE04_00355 [Acidobacteriia bacterium]|nr:hypothetical protein [Terriglobia bacterium]
MTNEDNGTRLDRIERGIEHLLQLASVHQTTLTGHDQQIADLRDIASRTLTMLEGVVQVSARSQAMLESLIQVSARNQGEIEKLIEAARHTDERLNALIGFVAGWRSQPPPAGS